MGKYTQATNKNPEQKARDAIDRMLRDSGWLVQNKNKIDFNAGYGIAIREYQTNVGPADYVLFVDRCPVGVIEAKKAEEGQNITRVEEQSAQYAHAQLRWISDNKPLPFIYESTGVLTRFRDDHDPKSRSREVFSFHRPETLAAWREETDTLRGRFQHLPELNPQNLRDCQTKAITTLEASFKQNRPRALIQMATGSGKTFTAITFIYRLFKHADAKRILFLVDTKNLGEQAEQEFMAYVPGDDNRKFTELYNVQRLKSSYIADSSQVCIGTIQRLYSILKGEPLDEAAEQENPAEHALPKKPLPVVYSEKIPIEYFDFIVIDECHRSIYNLWKQVLDYFDAFLIGLTATPDTRTYGFFKENVVSEYSHEDAVADGVNVGYDVYTIETEITKQGSKLKARQLIEKRNRLTRKKRWTQQDEDVNYSATQLDREVVNPSQIRKIIRTFRDKLPEIFPGRTEIPKTLIFAKTDSHADDIIQVVREEFDEGNEFCKKVTYQAKEDPKSVLAQFRNDYHPRIAVTVDMIATGTDVKPLECLLFMRDVKSRNYFEQMKGRGTRTLGYDDLKKVTPSVSDVSTDVKGEIYEGLLEKNAEDTKSGAGQYFTPRALIKAIVECVRPEPSRTIADPACGTGGFILAAYDFIVAKKLDKAQKEFLKHKTFYGNEIVPNTRRLALMNMFLHNIGEIDGEPAIDPTDALIAAPKKTFDYVLTNPPFGKKSSYTSTNGEGKEEKEDFTYNRQDFWATTSNKQLNFVQHVRTMLKSTGKAAVVVPDNVLFEGGAGETVRKKLLENTDLHTILRLPTGVFYAQGVKANVLFFDNREASKDPWTKEVWYYDYRTNIHHTLKKKQLRFEDLQDFVECYKPSNRHERKANWNEKKNPEGRWRKFTYKEIVARDKTSLDIFWLKDKSLADLDNLPEPEILAEEIIENLEAGLASFRAVAAGLTFEKLVAGKA